MKLELNRTKKGNVCLDLKQNEIEVAFLEKNQKIKKIFSNENHFVVIPQKGMLLGIKNQLYRLVKIDREFMGEQEEFNYKKVADLQQEHKFNYSALLIPSNRFTDRLEILYKKKEEEE